MGIIANKFSWIIPLSIVISTWYFIVLPNISLYPIEDYQRVNSPIDLGILMFIIMIMVLIIVLVPRPEVRWS